MHDFIKLLLLCSRLETFKRLALFVFAFVLVFLFAFTKFIDTITISNTKTAK